MRCDIVKKYAALQRVDNDHPITKDANSAFIYHLQHSLLLALKERGRLSEMQYRHAAKRLTQQLRDQTRKQLQKNEGNQE